jgi:DNA repair exonuclease SbcCD ATPase subunit
MNALEKLTQQEQRKSELDAAYAAQTQSNREIQQTNCDLREARSRLDQFERRLCDINGLFDPAALDDVGRERHANLKAEVERLSQRFAELDGERPAIKARIQAAQEGVSKSITVTAEEAIKQQTIVAHARAEAERITEAIAEQKDIRRQTLDSIEKNQAQVEAVNQDDLAKAVLGEIDPAEATESVTRMAGKHYGERRDEVAKIEAAIAGLNRRLEQAQRTVQTEEKRLRSLQSTFIETEYHKARSAYEKLAPKLVGALETVMGFNRLLRHHGLPGVNFTGALALPKFRGTDTRQGMLCCDRDIDLERGEENVAQALHKTGIEI